MIYENLKRIEDSHQSIIEEDDGQRIRRHLYVLRSSVEYLDNAIHPPWPCFEQKGDDFDDVRLWKNFPVRIATQMLGLHAVESSLLYKSLNIVEAFTSDHRSSFEEEGFDLFAGDFHAQMPLNTEDAESDENEYHVPEVTLTNLRHIIKSIEELFPDAVEKALRFNAYESRFRVRLFVNPLDFSSAFPTLDSDQIEIVKRLAALPFLAMTITELSGAIGRDRKTLTPKLDLLEEEGFVTRFGERKGYRLGPRAQMLIRQFPDDLK